MSVFTFSMIVISFSVQVFLNEEIAASWSSVNPADSLRDSTHSHLNRKSMQSKKRSGVREIQEISGEERVIYTGPKGGRYYINDDGGKVYIRDSVRSSVAERDTLGRTIYTGPRGGRYYFNEKGEKVYLKRKKETP